MFFLYLSCDKRIRAKERKKIKCIKRDTTYKIKDIIESINSTKYCLDIDMQNMDKIVKAIPSLYFVSNISQLVNKNRDAFYRFIRALFGFSILLDTYSYYNSEKVFLSILKIHLDKFEKLFSRKIRSIVEKEIDFEHEVLINNINLLTKKQRKNIEEVSIYLLSILVINIGLEIEEAKSMKKKILELSIFDFCRENTG